MTQLLSEEPHMSRCSARPERRFGCDKLIAIAAVCSLLTMLCGVPIAAAPANRVERDWARCPSIVQLETHEDVFAVGDVHGDYKRLVKLLAAGGLIQKEPETPDKVHWVGGAATLVCTGDLIDKGDRSLDVIGLFRALEKDSVAAGGRIIVTMGNHEAEFLADPEDDEKAAEFLKELEHGDVDPQDVARGRDHLGIGEFLVSLPFAAKVNDWFFVHAGNTKGQSLNDLSTALQSQVTDHGFGVPILSDADSLLESRLHPHPWWEREGEEPAESEARLRQVVTALGARHLVIGHQPNKAKFNDGTRRERGAVYEKFDGLIFLIDVGMSSAIDYSHGVLLRIHRRSSGGTVVHVIDHRGEDSKIWSGN
jgi:Calcineurin-like phosphoesterase